MKYVYRIYDKENDAFIKIGKRTNDIYVNPDLIKASLRHAYPNINIDDRFKIVQYELVRTNKNM